MHVGLVGQYRLARSTDSTDTSFASKIPTLTQPSGAGVLELGKIGGAGGVHKMRVIPFGTGGDDSVFEMRVIGWSYLGEGASRLWIPTPIAAFICTLSTAVGVATGALGSSTRFCDTITAATIPIEPTIAADVTRQGTIAISSPANNLVGFAMVPTCGFGVVEFTFDLTTGTPTGANALVAFF